MEASEIEAHPLPADSPELPGLHRVIVQFLLTLPKFTEWPASALENPTTPLVIGVLSGPEFGAYARRVLEAGKVNGHPVSVRVWSRAREIGACHVLYASPEWIGPLDAFMQRIVDKPVLTIGHREDFLTAGGIFRFLIEPEPKRQVRFSLSIENANRAGIRINATLRRMAEQDPPR